MAHRITANRDNVYVPGVGMLDEGQQGVISDETYAMLTAAGRFEDGLLTYVEDVTLPGEGPSLTSYSQVQALTGYPSAFPADLSALTPEAIGAQPAGDYQPAGSYATAAQGGKADSAVQPADLGTAAGTDATAYASAAQGAKADSALQAGDLPWTPTQVQWDALEARVAALETPPAG